MKRFFESFIQSLALKCALASLTTNERYFLKPFSQKAGMWFAESLQKTQKRPVKMEQVGTGGDVLGPYKRHIWIHMAIWDWPRISVEAWTISQPLYNHLLDL